MSKARCHAPEQIPQSGEATAWQAGGAKPFLDDREEQKSAGLTPSGFSSAVNRHVPFCPHHNPGEDTGIVPVAQMRELGPREDE